MDAHTLSGSRRDGGGESGTELARAAARAGRESEESTASPPRYYALKSADGGKLRSCIFLFEEDVLEYAADAGGGGEDAGAGEGGEDAGAGEGDRCAYERFGEIEDAVEYLARERSQVRKVTIPLPPRWQRAQPKRSRDGADEASDRPTAGSKKTRTMALPLAGSVGAGAGAGAGPPVWTPQIPQPRPVYHLPAQPQLPLGMAGYAAPHQFHGAATFPPPSLYSSAPLPEGVPLTPFQRRALYQCVLAVRRIRSVPLTSDAFAAEVAKYFNQRHYREDLLNLGGFGGVLTLQRAKDFLEEEGVDKMERWLRSQPSDVDVRPLQQSPGPAEASTTTPQQPPQQPAPPVGGISVTSYPSTQPEEAEPERPSNKRKFGKWARRRGQQRVRNEERVQQVNARYQKKSMAISDSDTVDKSKVDEWDREQLEIVLARLGQPIRGLMTEKRERLRLFLENPEAIARTPSKHALEKKATSPGAGAEDFQRRHGRCQQSGQMEWRGACRNSQKSRNFRRR